MVGRRAVLLGVGAVVGSAAALPPRAARRRIERCAEWDARTPAERPMPLERAPERILIHHAATENVADGSRRHAHEPARVFQSLHVDANERGSVDALPAGDRMVEGAHAYGQNRNSIPPAQIHGHRDVRNGTVCPGDAFHARLPRLRAQVAPAV